MLKGGGQRAHKNGLPLAANGPGRPPPPPTIALAICFSASIFCAILLLILPPTGAQLNLISLEDIDTEKVDWLRGLDNSKGKLKRQKRVMDEESTSMEESFSSSSSSMELSSSPTKRRGRAAAMSRFGDLLEEEEGEIIENNNELATITTRTQRRSHLGQRQQKDGGDNKFRVDARNPIHILFPLPTDEGRRNENPFGITILKAKPVVDEAVEEVYRRQLVPPNSLSIHFEDSMLSDAHGPNVAINQLVDNELDCIIGYAFVYALAPVARMSPFWRDKDSNGIPVITSVGLTSNLDNRREYQLMTRISSPYKVVKNAVLGLFSEMKWIKSAYLFHEQRHDAANPSIPYGECYLLMASVQPHLYRVNRMEHNYFMFNELNYDHDRMNDNLRKASAFSNGQSNKNKNTTNQCEMELIDPSPSNGHNQRRYKMLKNARKKF